MEAAGYVTGVYSSQASGIVDMQAAAASKASSFTPPDAVWIALWDNTPSLTDGTLCWPLTDRTKQYQGGVNTTIGGITMNIDKDIVGGPVAHLPQPGRGGVGASRQARRAGETGSREPARAHKLTTWPYVATVLTPSST